MAVRQSRMLELGTTIPDFRLPDPAGRLYSVADFRKAPAMLVAFISNHCPYVQHIRAGLAQFARDYQPRGLAMVAIGANDVAAYPQDGPDHMAVEVDEAGYIFPYLYDESQAVAKAFRAACTPDFFLFDAQGRLAYRGQFDRSRPGSRTPVTGVDLRAAADAVLAGQPAPAEQLPSIGCSIKWRPGQEPAWA